MMYGWIIGIIIIIVLIIALGRGGIFQNRQAGNAGRNTDSSALKTLENRYAKGEIDKKEFEEKKAQLEK